MSKSYGYSNYGSWPTNDNVDDYDTLFSGFTTLGSNSATQNPDMQQVFAEPSNGFSEYNRPVQGHGTSDNPFMLDQDNGTQANGVGNQVTNNFPGVTNEQLNTAILNISTRQYDTSNMNPEGLFNILRDELDRLNQETETLEAIDAQSTISPLPSNEQIKSPTETTSTAMNPMSSATNDNNFGYFNGGMQNVSNPTQTANTAQIMTPDEVQNLLNPAQTANTNQVMSPNTAPVAPMQTGQALTGSSVNQTGIMNMQSLSGHFDQQLPAQIEEYQASNLFPDLDLGFFDDNLNWIMPMPTEGQTGQQGVGNNDWAWNMSMTAEGQTGQQNFGNNGGWNMPMTTQNQAVQRGVGNNLVYASPPTGNSTISSQCSGTLSNASQTPQQQTQPGTGGRANINQTLQQQTQPDTPRPVLRRTQTTGPREAHFIGETLGASMPTGPATYRRRRESTPGAGGAIRTTATAPRHHPYATAAGIGRITQSRTTNNIGASATVPEPAPNPQYPGTYTVYRDPHLDRDNTEINRPYTFVGDAVMKGIRSSQVPAGNVQQSGSQIQKSMTLPSSSITAQQSRTMAPVADTAAKRVTRSKTAANVAEQPQSQSQAGDNGNGNRMVKKIMPIVYDLIDEMPKSPQAPKIDCPNCGHTIEMRMPTDEEAARITKERQPPRRRRKGGQKDQTDEQRAYNYIERMRANRVGIFHED
ncbi:Protein of unknown function [Pyronema omphalodes CBS 100304]|uniref:Uncharacterized protein n=1 Tax=Pyronema omphalodes (strain CBS 100304) TaxID=1076935 RepID=U4LPZ3_PYROM|nr:Protein of unknown function [Pyronema omphalodes CBS 100304]